jgi:hypothetical protein
VSEVEVAVCPRCSQPFPPGSDYCTHCGGQLGFAETTLPYIPVPNSARFSDTIDTERSDPNRLRPLFRAGSIAILVWVLSAWIFFATGSFGDHLFGSVLALGLGVVVGVVAWLYFTLAAKRARSGGLK